MPCSALRSRTRGLPSACADHTGTIPRPLQRVFDRYHAQLGSRPPQRAVHGTTPIEDHASHNGPSAQRAFVPRRHNALLHNERSYHTGITGVCTTELARRAFRKRNLPHHHQNWNASHAPWTPNGLVFSCRERAAQNDFKKARISRAKRSTATPCSAACRSACWVEPNHPIRRDG